MFLNNLVSIIKSDGKILREKNGVVSIPFGSEYSILIKNLDTRRAKVDIYIDGDSVLDSKSLIVYGDSQEELKGFLDENEVKNRFKFIQKNKDIEEHRGEHIDDGIVRIVFSFEQQAYLGSYYKLPEYNWYPRYKYTDPSPYKVTWEYSDNTRTYPNTINYSFVNVTNTSYTTPVCAYDGITVKGSPTVQGFTSSYIGDCGESYTITLKLSGLKEDNTKVKKIVTTSTKLTCPTCGKSWKSNITYCPNCGTYLK